MIKIIYAGDISDDGRHSPRRLLAREEVRRLVYQIHKKPVSRDEAIALKFADGELIDMALEGGVLADVSGVLYPTFPILIGDEVDDFESIATELGIRVASAVESVWDRFHDVLEEIEAYVLFDRPLSAYLLLGSFVLDAGMKQLMAKNGLMVIPSDTRLGYIFMGIEQGAKFPGLRDTTRVEETSWGLFLSFGFADGGPTDIASARLSIERALGGVSIGNVNVDFYRLLKHYLWRMFDDMGGVMWRVSTTGAEWDHVRATVGLPEEHFADLIGLMRDMGYVSVRFGRIYPSVPVVTHTDTPKIARMVSLAGDVLLPAVDTILEIHRERLRSFSFRSHPTVPWEWFMYFLWMRAFPRALEKLHNDGYVGMPSETVKSFVRYPVRTGG